LHFVSLVVSFFANTQDYLALTSLHPQK